MTPLVPTANHPAAGNPRVADAFAPDALLRALGDGTDNGTDKGGDAPWREYCAAHWTTWVSSRSHGDLPRWQAAVAAMPAAIPSRVTLAADCVTIGARSDLDDAQAATLETALRELHPWRKGPFDFFGTTIDTEWRSDWKWQRVLPHLAPLAGRRVLDVGCGSGYHLWRMRGAGAAFVLGIDPALRGLAQFAAAKKYLADEPVYFAPVALEDLPVGGATFDTVFSMGVIYHRRDPLAHLAELMATLRPGGELVLETLMIEGTGEGAGEGGDNVLYPPDRYAKMRNVIAIPSPGVLVQWLDAAGFCDARIVDVTRTTPDEQRQTGWMTYQSLADFLDPNDPSRTVEGHPAPVRAVAIATKPARPCA